MEHDIKADINISELHERTEPTKPPNSKTPGIGRTRAHYLSAWHLIRLPSNQSDFELDVGLYVNPAAFVYGVEKRCWMEDFRRAMIRDCTKYRVNATAIQGKCVQ